MSKETVEYKVINDPFGLPAYKCGECGDTFEYAEIEQHARMAHGGTHLNFFDVPIP